MPVSAAITELIDSSGTQFDPRVVETLLRVLDEPASATAEGDRSEPSSPADPPLTADVPPASPPALPARPAPPTEPAAPPTESAPAMAPVASSRP